MFQILFSLDTPKCDGVTFILLSAAPSDPITLAFQQRSWKLTICEIVFSYVYPKQMITILFLLDDEILASKIAPEADLP